MATTITGLIFENNRVVMAYCGNTGIYALQGSFLKQVASDHTTYQWLLDKGQADIAKH